MELMEMFEGAVNSVETQLTADISAVDTEITVQNGNILPDAPNLLTIGGDAANVETVMFTNKNGNILTVVRAFQGAAKEWEAGTIIARYMTEYDHAAFIHNIKQAVEKLVKHEETAVTSEDGAHGIRYHDEILQIFYEDEWIDISVNGGNSAHLGAAILGSAYLGG